jgi:hypothetical protein
MFNPNGVTAFPQPIRPQPRWGWRDLLLLPQVSSCLATLGWMTQSLWDWAESPGKLWVMTRVEAHAPASTNGIPYAD